MPGGERSERRLSKHTVNGVWEGTAGTININKTEIVIILSNRDDQIRGCDLVYRCFRVKSGSVFICMQCIYRLPSHTLH